jgi:hypothetical protein
MMPTPGCWWSSPRSKAVVSWKQPQGPTATR